MDDTLISSFIDDELDLDEKITFVETVQHSQPFAVEAVALLEQEKMLHALPMPLPATAMPASLQKPSMEWSRLFQFWWRPMAGFATALVLVALTLVLLPRQPELSRETEYRFVVYLPQANQARIIGTFTDWTPVDLQRVGSQGYWALSLKVVPGEHRYSYLLEDGTQLVDPTVVTREHDDFGGENSVITIGGADDPVS